MSLVRCSFSAINQKTSLYQTIQFIRYYSSKSKKKQKFPEIDNNTARWHNALLDIAADRKKVLNQSKPAVEFDKRTASKPKDNDYNIQIALLQAKTSDEIFSIIQKHWTSIKVPGLYSIAMKRCIKLRDWAIIRQIMDLLIYSNVVPTIFEFTQFFNAMALSAISPKISDQYFKRMCNDFGITPDKFIFSILIKGCRKECMYELAESYWISMQITYKIAPSSWLYTEMISVYGKANQIKKGTKLFKQYCDKLIEKQIRFDVTTFHAFLSIFAQNGDIEGMEKALAMMKEFNIELNKLFVTEIMNGYIRGRKPKRAIDTFNSLVHIHVNDESECDMKGKEPMFELKCVALSHIMRGDGNMSMDLDKKFAIYEEIKCIINKLMTAGYKANFAFFHAKTLLYASIIMFHDNEPAEIVNVFEDLVKKGYIAYVENENGNVIDLHLFELLQVQFILRYVIGNIECNDRDLILIVGAGKHNLSDRNNKGNIKQFVIKELLTYEPPIQCKEDLQNKGILRIGKEELVPYLNDKNNYAMQKLMNPSKDWYWNDSRETT